MKHLIHRIARATVVASGVVVAASAALVSAHIEPTPPAVEAGTPASVSFGVEHGCSGSPTVRLDFQIPAGVSGAAGVAKDGWTATLAGQVLTFAGGPLADETPDDFSISFTAPATAGDLHFPVVQTCETGETAWIDVAAEGQPEPEHPAPTVKVTAGPPTAADLTPEEEAATATPASSDDSSNTGLIVGLAAAVVVIGGVSAVTFRRRTR